MAFVASTPRLPLGTRQTNSLSGRLCFRPKVQVRLETRACLPTQSASDAKPVSDVSQDAEPLQAASKTERIAAMLGKSKQSLEQSRDDVLERDRKDKRKRYTAALISALIGTSAFLAQRLDPNSGVRLLRYMYAHSESPAVIGTNNKPTLMEFSTTWCSNCKASARTVFDLENRYIDRVNFLIFNGEDPNNAEILERYSVDGIPQFSMITRDGTVKGNLVGRIPREVLAEDLDALLEDRELPFPGLPLDALRPDSMR
ncbi:unnamed protein product [Agarophyton chilense]